MLKYPSSHRGKSQNAPKKRLNCTFCIYILQSLIYNLQTVLQSLTKAHTQELKPYSKHMNHTSQLELPSEPQSVVRTILCNYNHHMNNTMQPQQISKPQPQSKTHGGASQHSGPMSLSHRYSSSRIRGIWNETWKLNHVSLLQTKTILHFASKSNVEHPQPCAGHLLTISPIPL